MTPASLFAAVFALVFALALPTGAMAQSTPPGAPPEASVEEGAFLSVVEDVPLMPGLVEDEAGAVVFDAAQGRIAETVAIGSPGRPAVLAFYGETLPALGWRADGEARWTREGETLSLEFEDPPAGRKGLAVRFSLSPTHPR